MEDEWELLATIALHFLPFFCAVGHHLHTDVRSLGKSYIFLGSQLAELRVSQELLVVPSAEFFHICNCVKASTGLEQIGVLGQEVLATLASRDNSPLHL